MTKELEQRFKAIDKGQYFIDNGFKVGDKLLITAIQDTETGEMCGGDYGTVLSVKSHVDGDDLFGDNVIIEVVTDVIYEICGVVKHCKMSFVNDLDTRPKGHRPNSPSFLRNIYHHLDPMECYWYKCSDGDGTELYDIHRLKT